MGGSRHSTGVRAAGEPAAAAGELVGPASRCGHRSVIEIRRPGESTAPRAFSHDLSVCRYAE
jgi:hypothetical protein